MPFHKITGLLLCLSALAIPVHAHDFWLAPETYNPSPNQNTPVSVMIGHPTDQMTWSISPHRIVAFRSFGPSGVQDHQADIMEASASRPVSVTLNDPGLHILTLETTHAVSKLEADKFNAYLDEEGLTPIKLDRTANGTTDTPGTEIYSRRGKTLIQVGKPSQKDPDYLSRPLGLTLEIVPETHPARVAEGEPMVSTVYYRGEPMRGITIGLIDLKGDKGLVDIYVSDQAGQTKIPRPADGNWMMHAVWAAPLNNSDRADYDTVFSSLSFSLD